MRRSLWLLVAVGLLWVCVALWLLGSDPVVMPTTQPASHSAVEVGGGDVSAAETRRVPLTTSSSGPPRPPRSTPNGVILYLQGGRWDRFFTAHALPSLEAYVLRCLPNMYPVHVFTEAVPATDQQASMRELVPSAKRLDFEDVGHIWRRLPHNISEQALQGWMAARPGFQGRGYRIMCRFWAGLVWHLDSMSKYEYYWRLDTDSVFLTPIQHDPFVLMVSRGCEYGYNRIKGENPHVSMGLFEAYNQWVRSEQGQPDFMSPGVAKTVQRFFIDKDGYNRTMFYNNFELGTIAMKRSRVYQSLFQYLDERPPFGIFQFRWGDAPIHTLGVMSALQGDWSKICYYPREQFNYRHALKHPPPISTNRCEGPIQPL